MRGLDPRIHRLRKTQSLIEGMDCRVKPGNDALKLARMGLVPRIHVCVADKASKPDKTWPHPAMTIEEVADVFQSRRVADRSRVLRLPEIAATAC
jgi:hypothetical protein